MAGAGVTAATELSERLPGVDLQPRLDAVLDASEVAEVVAHAVVAEDRNGQAAACGRVVPRGVPAVAAPDLEDAAIDRGDERRAAPGGGEDVRRRIVVVRVGVADVNPGIDRHDVRRRRRTGG